MNTKFKYTLNVLIYIYLLQSIYCGNDLRSAEGKLSNSYYSTGYKERQANCLDLNKATQQQVSEFFMNENFNDMNILGSGHFGQVREPQSNNQKQDSEKIVFKKTEVKYGQKDLAINEYYYWQFIQDSKQYSNSGFYKSKSFPEYYGCSYESANYYNSQNSDIEIIFYMKMEKINSNFFNKDNKQDVVSFTQLTELQQLKTYLSLFKAIRELHSEDIVHLDIKPDNFMTRDNFNVQEPDYPKIVLVDMGLAQPAGRLYSIGNLQFMHPTAFARQDNFPMIKAFDVYSAILSIIVIEGYKKGFTTNQFFQAANYPRGKGTVSQKFNQLFKQIDQEFNLTDQINIFSNLKAQNIEECFNLNCLLSFGMNDDINEIPTIEQFYNQLEKIINYLQKHKKIQQNNQKVFDSNFKDSINFFDQAEQIKYCSQYGILDTQLLTEEEQQFQSGNRSIRGYGGSLLYKSIYLQKFNNSKPFYNRKLNSIHYVQTYNNNASISRIVQVEKCFIGKIESYYKLESYKMNCEIEKVHTQSGRSFTSDSKQLENYLLQNDVISQYKQLFMTLKTLHKSQIVHLHISPQNIVVDQNNNLKFLDYGLQNLSEPISTVDLNFSHPRMFQDKMAYTFYDIYSLTLSIFYIESVKIKKQATNNQRLFPININFEDYFKNKQQFMNRVDQICENIKQIFEGIVTFPSQQGGGLNFCEKNNQDDYSKVMQ